MTWCEYEFTGKAYDNGHGGAVCVFRCRHCGDEYHEQLDPPKEHECVEVTA